jgi:hypothetical protein
VDAGIDTAVSTRVIFSVVWKVGYIYSGLRKAGYIER